MSIYYIEYDHYDVKFSVTGPDMDIKVLAVEDVASGMCLRLEQLDKYEQQRIIERIEEEIVDILESEEYEFGTERHIKDIKTWNY